MEIFFHLEEYFHAICFSLHLFHSVYVNLQLHDLIKQLSSAKTYFICSSGNIPIGSLQRIQNELSVKNCLGFFVTHLSFCLSSGFRKIVRKQLFRSVFFQRQHSAVTGQNDHPFDDVFQFSDVSAVFLLKQPVSGSVLHLVDPFLFHISR